MGALKTIEIYISSFFALFFFSIEKNKKNRREEKTFILFGVMNDNLWNTTICLWLSKQTFVISLLYVL